jgi:DNA helicase II / ATP-dependent DNA helicase PcrA
MGQIKLNPKQQEAVDHVYGPLLVLAGPGTGKTQLLSARIANILTITDAAPQNILCLTFTENAAQNMRERLASIIKDDAYDVHIGTYHSFGSDIIRTYPQYFDSIDLETGKDTRMERPIDDLQRIQIVTEIVGRLPFSSPLIGARHYIKNVVATISELKRGLYTPESLKKLGEDNLKQVRELSPKISDLLGGIKRFPSKADQSIELFGPVLQLLEGLSGLAESAAGDIGLAMVTAHDTGKSTPLTEWKNKWLTKDEDNQFVFTDEAQHLRMIELAVVYGRYQHALEDKQLYDFDDMILRTIQALKTRDDLRFTLQEKYQFILLDEFQDTNAAQFELVKLMADNPVNEGQPNIFAVGDDDQAIYAFQGASISNMYAFKQTFRDVKVVNLTENYRSHPDILHTAHGIAGQIESRLHHQIEGVNKTLVASSKDLPKDATIERHEFDGEANEHSWVADRIHRLISDGTKPHEIAILAPQHKYLESVVPFLARQGVPIAYEKRENILETPMVRMFRSMIELVIACHEEDSYKMNELLPQVLSYDFYQLPVVDIWRVNWELARDKSISWAEHALSNEMLAPHVMFYLGLGMRADTEPLEYMLDYLTGTTALQLDAESSYTSPFKEFYFASKDNALTYFESLANLSTIREHLRAWQSGQDKLLTPQDFLRFIGAYETAEQPLINTHPLALADDSVQLMTTFKAKGLEFEHVFLLSVHDDVWGKSARTNSNKLSLPPNLQHIRFQGEGEDGLRRALFVAITRAKHGLYLTSHAHKDNGKSTEPVKYLLEFGDGDERKTSVLPDGKKTVQRVVFDEASTMQAIDTMWHSRHVRLDASLKSLLSDRLSRYQMSPTHLNTFIDLEYGGPEALLLRTLLRFPQAPGEDGEYGNAVHYTLEQHQLRLGKGEKSGTDQVLKDFDRNLGKRYITPDRMDDYRGRGHTALKGYLSARSDMFSLEAVPEVNFSKEGVVLGDAHLSGKIDRLEVDKATKTVRIVDFKTGKPHTKWERELKLLKYKQQLYFYKILIEGSHTWQGYSVAGARLEFVEPDTSGKVVAPLEVSFDATEEKEIKDLIKVIWDKVQSLDLPDISGYSDDYRGALDFIASLTSPA